MGYRKDIRLAAAAIFELLRELREHERAGNWEQLRNNAHSVAAWAYELENAAENKLAAIENEGKAN